VSVAGILQQGQLSAAAAAPTNVADPRGHGAHESADQRQRSVEVGGGLAVEGRHADPATVLHEIGDGLIDLKPQLLQHHLVQAR
jgi:hypothetical protein